MEVILTNPSDSTVAAGPRWVLLNRDSEHDRDSSADAKTTAASCTSSGLPFTVSFSAAAPPAASTFHGHWVGGGGTPANDDGEVYSCSDDDDCSYCSYAIADGKNFKGPELKIIAAHDEAVLIEMTMPLERGSYSASADTSDYFLYEAGGGRRPPSLSLLPGCYVSMQYQRDNDARQVPTATPMARSLSSWNDTGVLRRGEGEVLVAELEMPPLYGAACNIATAELCVLGPGGHDWVLKQVPIVHHEGDSELPRWSEMDAVVPVGSRFMCWVDYTSGFLVCDMAEENPKLRYVPLPVLAPQTRHRRSIDRPDMRYCRTLAAAGAGAGAVRFVSVAPRCCCGGPGTTTCERSSSAFNVTTWTLALRMEEPMAWVKDGVLDCGELWQLPNYGCLPRVALEFPMVSSDDADVVCFTVSKYHDSIDGAHDETVWMVEINTRSKALLSVVRSDKEDCSAGDILPAKLHW